MLAGPTGSGKTELLLNILASNLIIKKHEKSADVTADCKTGSTITLNITFNEGLPDVDEIDSSLANLVILDNLMTNVGKDKSISDLFTVDSHHKNISVIFLS